MVVVDPVALLVGLFRSSEKLLLNENEVATLPMKDPLADEDGGG